MTIHFSSKTASTVFKILLAIIFVLILLHVIALALDSIDNESRLFDLIEDSFKRLFNVNEEANIPTMYSSLALMACSILLAVIAIAKKQTNQPYVVLWAILSVGFLYLATDETAIIHEMFNKPGQLIFGEDSIDGLWIVFAAIPLALLAVFYWRFIFDLPPRTRNLFILAGGLYLFGTIGLEFFSSGLFEPDSGGIEGILYYGLQTLEEAIEMGSIALFIYALLNYIHSEVGDIYILADGSA
ncbi:MAG: hypothetical protein KC546_15505 [Anaerolineae bacterium]|nr:hypothetical protein [Anaerolineae bacterium]